MAHLVKVANRHEAIGSGARNSNAAWRASPQHVLPEGASAVLTDVEVVVRTVVRRQILACNL